MARIRTIKPEFPHSESMGRVSRDARLTFILLWTLADDAGRLRGSSRMLASLLFPYDLDAHEGIGKWLVELEAEQCIVRYDIAGSAYLQITKWTSHQKIDRPSASKLPAHEPSREIANPREPSSGDRDQDQGPKDQDRDLSAAPTDNAVLLIFNHWRTVHKHPAAKLDSKRQSRIQEALQSFSTEQLCSAITGYASSPHHTGSDPKGTGTKFDDIELLLRDTKHIEAGLEFFANPPRSRSNLQPRAPDFPSDPYRGAI